MAEFPKFGIFGVYVCVIPSFRFFFVTKPIIWPLRGQTNTDGCRVSHMIITDMLQHKMYPFRENICLRVCPEKPEKNALGDRRTSCESCNT